MKINSVPGFVLNAEELNIVTNSEHIEMAFKHRYYWEPNKVNWTYVEARRWNIGLFSFFWWSF